MFMCGMCVYDCILCDEEGEYHLFRALEPLVKGEGMQWKLMWILR